MSADAAIWKFLLGKPGEATEHRMPGRGRALHFGVQDGQFCVWCLVFPDEDLAPTAFQIIGTGWSVPYGWGYVGTVQDGPYIWHLFQAQRGIASPPPLASLSRAEVER